MEEQGIRREIISNLFTALGGGGILPPKYMQGLENKFKNFKLKNYSSWKRRIMDISLSEYPEIESEWSVN